LPLLATPILSRFSDKPGEARFSNLNRYHFIFSYLSILMTKVLTPHSHEWFEVLLQSNHQQARHTAHIIRLAGSAEACSICGDRGATDYQMPQQEYAPGIVATIRLCDGCKEIRERALSVEFLKLEEGA
jgi:hypothetical protein